MPQTYNIYCDESCHLEHDGHPVMVLGAIWCPLDRTHEIAVRLREFKMEHGLDRDFELKWTKVSPAKLPYYQRVLDYFFDDDDLHFRAVIIPDKTKLDHDLHGQTHDDWYYKMMFDLLKVIFEPDTHYRIYLDIKDTRSAAKIQKLKHVIEHSKEKYEFKKSTIEWIQNIRSEESEQLQITDLLIGAVAYANHGHTTSKAKLVLVQRMRDRSGYRLDRTTLFKENKVNLFRWRAQEH